MGITAFFAEQVQKMIKAKDPSVKTIAEVFLHPGIWAIAATHCHCGLDPQSQ